MGVLTTRVRGPFFWIANPERERGYKADAILGFASESIT